MLIVSIIFVGLQCFR